MRNLLIIIIPETLLFLVSCFFFSFCRSLVFFFSFFKVRQRLNKNNYNINKIVINFVIFFAVPLPKFYVQLNPIQINFDICSCLWFNSFLLNLYYSLLGDGKKSATNAANLMYFDVKIEAILPRVSKSLFE